MRIKKYLSSLHLDEQLVMDYIIDERRGEAAKHPPNQIVQYETLSPVC
jgi:hypothetical protein